MNNIPSGDRHIPPAATSDQNTEKTNQKNKLPTTVWNEDFKKKGYFEKLFLLIKATFTLDFSSITNQPIAPGRVDKAVLPYQKISIIMQQKLQKLKEDVSPAPFLVKDETQNIDQPTEHPELPSQLNEEDRHLDEDTRLLVEQEAKNYPKTPN